MAMTRASEFCYIAEHEDGEMLMAMSAGSDLGYQSWRWTREQELAMRMTKKWCEALAGSWPIKLHRTPLGFRKILVG